MSKTLMIASTGLALFIVCPRMAGMVHVIAKYSQVSLIYTALLGSLLSVPLVVCIVLVFDKFGLFGALAFCVLTDLLSAWVMKEVDVRAGIETLVVAIFVIIGVKVAPYVTDTFIK